MIDPKGMVIGLKIIYMGTPDFAASALEAIIAAGHEVTAVVTQPDRPKGRSTKLVPSPVKEIALANNIPVLQPLKIRKPEAVEELKQYEADVYVVAAFGQILSQEILDIPRFGCINIHASLLPHLRGSAPIQYSILQGDTQTGITIMQMDRGIDTGDILLQEKIDILPTDTGGSLFDKLSLLGAELIVKALPLIEKGELTPIAQDEDKADYVGMLNKSMGKIDFKMDAVQIERNVRGLDPWPGAFTYYNGKQLKLWHCGAVSTLPDDPYRDERPNKDIPGTIIEVLKDAIYVRTGNGILRIDELQLEGKKRMSVQAFLAGFKLNVGEMLGDN